jgi:hypothetical protein
LGNSASANSCVPGGRSGLRCKVFSNLRNIYENTAFF